MQPIRRPLVLGGLCAGALIVAACSDSPDPDPLAELERSTGSSWAVQRDPVLGTPSFLMPRKEGSVIRQAGESPSAAAARFLERYRAVIGIRNVGEELVAEASDEGADDVGLHHASFSQKVDGIPVLGLRYSVHFDRAGHVAFVSGRYRKDLDGFGTKPAFSEADAIAKAVATLATTKSEMQTATLVIEPTMPNARLVWNVDLGVEDGGSRRVTIDATNGAIVSSASLVRRATATGKGVRHYATSSLKLSVDRSLSDEVA
jgi:Zn-dependent metalloprotease